MKKLWWRLLCWFDAHLDALVIDKLARRVYHRCARCGREESDSLPYLPPNWIGFRCDPGEHLWRPYTGDKPPAPYGGRECVHCGEIVVHLWPREAR